MWTTWCGRILHENNCTPCWTDRRTPDSQSVFVVHRMWTYILTYRTSRTVVVPWHTPGVSLTSYDLLKEYFEHDIREKCSHCGGIVSIKQSLSSILQTLRLLLKRVYYRVSKGRVGKIGTHASPNETVDPSPFTESLCSTRYKLKSVVHVAHHGRSYISGHYTTFIPGETGGYIEVSDTESSSASVDKIHRTAM